MATNIERELKGFKKRIRLLLIERHALMVGAVGVGIAAVFVALSKWYYSLSEPVLLLGIVLLSMAAGAIWGMARKLTDFTTARATEKRLDLKERLSSAVAFPETEDGMVKALVQDAGQHIDSVRPNTVFPHRFNREMAVFGVMMVVLLGLYYVPQISSLQSPTRREEVRVMKQEGKKLRKLAKEAVKHISPDNKEIAKRIALNMDRLGKKLESGRMSRKQAMLALKKLDKQIKDVQDRIASRNLSPKSMAQALKDLESMSPGLAESMQARIEKELQQSLASGKSDKELEDLLKRIKNMQSSTGGMSGKQMQDAEKKLKEFMKSGNNGVPVPPELSAVMSELLKNEDYKKASELMSELAKKLGKRGNMSKMDAKNLEEQLKALSEALKNTDMNELAKKLREAAEQLAKMDPKKAAEMMKQAAKAAQKSNDLAQLGKMSGG